MSRIWQIYPCKKLEGWGKKQRCIYLVMWPHSWPQDFFFHAEIFKSGDFMCSTALLPLQPEVYISSHVAFFVATRFFFFMQKYSNQGISCKYIQIRVFYAEILVRYRYALPSHARLTIWIGHGCNVYSFSGSIDQ